MLFDKLMVGDEVTIKIGKENLEWGYGKDIHLRRGRIVGFGEFYEGYVNNFGREPGVYENKSWPEVEVDGAIHQISGCFVHLIAEDPNRKPIPGARLRALPGTKFWPGDSVKYTGNVEWLLKEDGLVVQAIEYSYLGSMCNDGVTPMPCNRVDLQGGGYVNIGDHDLELVERGNVYKYYNGGTPVFKDLREEANFFESLGHTEEVRNPRLKLYKWENEDRDGKPYPAEALQALRDGIGHTIKVSSGLFGGGPYTSVRKFRDADLGERVRRATLEGFGG